MVNYQCFHLQSWARSEALPPNRSKHTVVSSTPITLLSIEYLHRSRACFIFFLERGYSHAPIQTYNVSFKVHDEDSDHSLLLAVTPTKSRKKLFDTKMKLHIYIYIYMQASFNFLFAVRAAAAWMDRNELCKLVDWISVTAQFSQLHNFRCLLEAAISAVSIFPYHSVKRQPYIYRWSELWRQPRAVAFSSAPALQT